MYHLNIKACQVQPDYYLVWHSKPMVATMRWSSVWLCFLALSVGSVTDVQGRLGKIVIVLDYWMYYSTL